MARRRRGQFPEPKKERGQWRIRYYADVAQPDGSIQRKRKTKCLGKVDEMTLTEARKETMKFLQAINDCEPGTEQGEKTMNNLVQQWRLKVKPNLKRSTQDSYEWAFKRIQPSFGRWPVSEIEKIDIQGFLTRVSTDLSGKSVTSLRTHLSGVLSIAEEWQWIRPGSNPARGRLRLPEETPVRPKRILTPPQFQELVRKLPEPYGTIVLLALLTGLRKGEIEALRWNDILPSAVLIDEAVYRGVLGTPKSRKSRRRVDIGPIVRTALRKWKCQSKFTQPDDFVFSIRTSSPIDLHNVVARHVKPACRRLALPLVSWHDLRHTYTTWGRQAGIIAETMRDQLGHRSVQMTLDVYSHVDDRRSAAVQIEQYACAVTVRVAA